LLTAIKTIEAPDPLTVKITLKNPWGPFLADMTFFTDGVFRRLTSRRSAPLGWQSTRS